MNSGWFGLLRSLATVVAADAYARYFIIIFLHYHYFYYFRHKCPPIIASRGNSYHMRKIIIISLFIRSRFIKLSRALYGASSFLLFQHSVDGVTPPYGEGGEVQNKYRSAIVEAIILPSIYSRRRWRWWWKIAASCW